MLLLCECVDVESIHILCALHFHLNEHNKYFPAYHYNTFVRATGTGLNLVEVARHLWPPLANYCLIRF